MKKLAKITMALMALALMAGISVAPSNSHAADSSLCDGVDKYVLERHLPFSFESIVSTEEFKSLNVCQVFIRVRDQYGAVYVAADKSMVIAGEVFKDRRGLSEEKIAKFESSDFDQYKEEVEKTVAFSYKPANAKKHIYMFTDPDCPYCEKAKSYVKQFADESNVEVRVVFYPLPSHPEARTKAVKAVCSGMDYEGYLVNGYKGDTCEKGEKVIADSLDIVRKLKINGTPTFIGESGRRVPGFAPQKLKELI